MFRRAMLIAVCAGSAGCGLIDSHSDFVIHIDSIAGPLAVPAGAPFQQFFWGPVGHDGCFYFKEFRVNSGAAGADISVIGEESHGGGDCTQMPTAIRGEPLTLPAPAGNPFLLRVHQPDGTVLTKSIQVQ